MSDPKRIFCTKTAGLTYVFISSFIRPIVAWGGIPEIEQVFTVRVPGEEDAPWGPSTSTWLQLTPSNYTIINHINKEIIRLELYAVVRKQPSRKVRVDSIRRWRRNWIINSCWTIKNGVTWGAENVFCACQMFTS